MGPIDAEQAPSALVQQQFAPKKDMGPYDGLTNPPAGGCDLHPGPAEPLSMLHCAQTSSPSWIAYRWYKFVDQPTMQRAKLSPAQSEFVQGRVERLHRMLAAGGDAAGKWIKERGPAEQLATVD